MKDITEEKQDSDAWVNKHLDNIKRIQKELAIQHAKDKEADYVNKMNKRKNRGY